MSTTEWTEVSRVEWTRDHGPMFGGPAGTDHYREVVTVRTWPEDGSVYAGRTYQRTRRTINGVTDMFSEGPYKGGTK